MLKMLKKRNCSQLILYQEIKVIQISSLWTEYGEIVDRATTKASDDRTINIAIVILNCIKEKGYCTEKEVVYILGSQYRYDTTETQIKRSLNEIMDSYGLKKVKSNNELKKKFNIKSDGYPNIIIEVN